MDDMEETIRRRAYELAERAGFPHGRSEEFWDAACREIAGDDAIDAELFDCFAPPIDEPPEVAFQHGGLVGLPGERIAEQGVEDDRLADLLPFPRLRPDD